MSKKGAVRLVNPISLYIDADACPVKQEIYRVAERHAGKGVALKVFVVSNAPIAVPRNEMIERVVVGAGMDEADNWIAARARRGDIVITADVPLASRAVKAGAEVIAPNGKPFWKNRSAWRWRRAISWIRCARPARSPAAQNPSRRATAPNSSPRWTAPSCG